MKKLSWLAKEDFQEAWKDSETGLICVMYGDKADINESQTIEFTDVEEFNDTLEIRAELKEKFGVEI